jgi:hypothetical protein
VTTGLGCTSAGVAGVGLVVAACSKREESEKTTTPVDRSKLDQFVKTILDRNRDGKFDPSELTPSQLAHILTGQRPVTEKDPRLGRGTKEIPFIYRPENC